LSSIVGFFEFVLQQLLVVDVGAGPKPLAALFHYLNADTFNKKPPVLAVLPQEPHLGLIRDFSWALTKSCPRRSRRFELRVLVSERRLYIIVIPRDVGWQKTFGTVIWVSIFLATEMSSKISA
jgi:hypothetical protein